MKVTLRKTATRPRQYLSDLPGLAIRAVLLLVGAMVLFLTLLIVLRPDFLQRTVTTVDQRWGSLCLLGRSLRIHIHDRHGWKTCGHFL